MPSAAFWLSACSQHAYSDLFHRDHLLGRVNATRVQAAVPLDFEACSIGERDGTVGEVNVVACWLSSVSNHQFVHTQQVRKGRFEQAILDDQLSELAELSVSFSVVEELDETSGC